MASKRMFSLAVIDSDAFLSLPATAQNLYFHLNMRADDDGFVDSPKKIMRIIGATEGDIQQLLQKRYLIAFDSGVIVIKHWRLHNTLQSDRYKPTLYKEEKEKIAVKDNKTYTEKNDKNEQCFQNVSKVESQYRLGKDREDKNSIDNTALGIFMPLANGVDYLVTNTMIENYKKVYTNVGVDLEISKMRLWLESNPKKRKTNSGMPKFINNWLSRTSEKQQSGSPNNQNKNVEMPTYSKDTTIKGDIKEVDDEIEHMLKAFED